jgi:tRNA dimethylallyltransferase
MPIDTNPVICVVGPTASGKSDLAQQLALKYNGEIVSADSMQIYKGMDIGTGKVLPHERVCAHFGIDLIDPGCSYSAALFQEYARKCFFDISARNRRPILAGGTGFYVRAAIDAYDFPKGEQEQNLIRQKYQDYLANNGAQKLWELLNDIDSQSAALIHPNNSVRVIRALELAENGESYARQAANLSEITQTVPAVFIGLEVTPSVLIERINRRVDKMREAGLTNEVHTLLSSGFRSALTAAQAIGYKEIVAAFDGEYSIDEAFEKIKIATRRYAKRQRTWFRKDKRIHWINADKFDIDEICNTACNIIDSTN